MNIVLIKTFLEILETKNLNKAAEKLHVTQSTISVRMNALEDMLGQKLFVRSKSGAELTYAGFLFHRHAEILIQVWEQAKQSVALPTGFSETLNIGCDLRLWKCLIDRWTYAMRAELGNIALSVWSGERDTLSRWLTSGLVDVAISYDPQLRQGIEVSPLYLEHLVLVSTDPQTFTEFERNIGSCHNVFVDWGDEFRQEYARHFQSKHAPAITFGDETAALDYILSRGGLGYISLRASSRELRSGRLQIVTGAPYFVRQVYLSSGISAKSSSGVESAVSLLREDIVASVTDMDHLKSSLGEVMNRRNQVDEAPATSFS